MPQTVTNFVELPYSTGGTEEGPELNKQGTRLIVSFDDCQKWCAIEFESLAGLKITPDIAVTEFQIEAYSKICTIGDFEWIEELRSQAQDDGMMLLDTYKHYMLYFDHQCCLEVVAGEYKINCEQNGGGNSAKLRSSP